MTPPRSVAPGTATAWPPSVAMVQRFFNIAERYGYWNATPAENAEIGLRFAGSPQRLQAPRQTRSA